MGLTKQYLAYRPQGLFNIITSEKPNVAFITHNKIDGRYVAVGAAKNVFIWDLKLGEKVLELCEEKEEVTALQPSPDRIHLTVGYSNGTIELFNLTTGDSVCSMALHRSSVAILRYDQSGMKLVSGGSDTDLVLVDIVAQVGKCRLSGHTAPITDACFYSRLENVLLSSSKDTQIKFWNVDTQCCFRTIVDHSLEVWKISLVQNSNYLLAGSGDSSMNVYKLTSGGDNLETTDDDIETNNLVKCNFVGSITRAGKGRTVNLVSDPTGKVIACHGVDNLIEVFYFCDESESIQRMNKRLKKLSLDKTNQSIALNDEIRRVSNFNVGQKIKSMDLLIGDNDELRIVVTLASNKIQLFSLNIEKKHSEATSLRTIKNVGHRSAARSVAFSLDGNFIASGSGDSLKIWERKSMRCIKTVEETGHILCCCFTAGDRFALLGLKNGDLLIVDTLAGDIIERIGAHTKELWNICLLPDLRGCITGGGDATIKFWTFKLIDVATNSDGDNKQISLLHKGTHNLEESVISLKISSNHKFIAAGLLDSTVKIFFADSLKFYLSLYGHKLPVLCLDISDDSAKIVTGSADRNVKIWGMDFGDCHKSLFAHDDSVMALQFIPKTHLFWTCGKDGKLKQWDADSFDKIITLNAHIGEVFSLAIDPSGEYLVSSGSDKVLRLYGRTDETIVLQDVQEDEREEMENKLLNNEENTIIPLLPNLNLPSRKTVGSERGTENILECLDVLKEFEESNEKNIPPLMVAYGAQTSVDYLITILSKIRPSDVEEALILLPFASACDILERATEMLDKRKDHTELVIKIVLSLFRMHHKAIVGNQILLPILQKMLQKLEGAVTDIRDMIGENKHGLLMLQKEVETNDGVELFKDIALMKKSKDKKQKNRELKRLHIQMS